MYPFFIYPPKERKIIYAISVTLALIYISVEIWFYNYAPLLNLSFELLSILKYSAIATMFLFIFLLSYYNYNVVRKAEAALQQERDKSENLLLNILPKPIVERLKSKPGSIADKFENATILFADIVNFTKLSENMSASEIVNMLDEIFSQFDVLAEKHKLEKIKTIGDAYMVAGGIPEKKENHLESVVEMALDMQSLMQNGFSKKFKDLNIRIGIHSGAIVAGVIGQKKFIYDLWGDSVNTASRMESHGIAGKIQVTEEVYNKLKNKYEFESRGKIEIKGKGEMNTYLLVGRK
jgi:class 3 adenylate cyclase